MIMQKLQKFMKIKLNSEKGESIKRAERQKN